MSSLRPQQVRLVSILLDDREDATLAGHLARFGLPVTVCRLDYGDLVIQSSEGLLIGYERKRLPDLIQSMQERRLSGRQFRGMYRIYDRIELVVESIWRPGDNGEILIPSNGGWRPLYHNGSGISYRQIDSYLYSQCELTGVRVWRTMGPAETAQMYASRWHWWQKPYHLHHSHDVLFSNNPSAQKRGAVTMHQGDPNDVTMVAAQCPGLDAKSWDVGEHFATIRDMANATVADWRSVEWTDRSGNTKHFGKDTARQIVAWFRGEKII